jgi:hypothetical protein
MVFNRCQRNTNLELSRVCDILPANKGPWSHSVYKKSEAKMAEIDVQ